MKPDEPALCTRRNRVDIRITFESSDGKQGTASFSNLDWAWTVCGKLYPGDARLLAGIAHVAKDINRWPRPDVDGPTAERRSKV